MNLVELILGSFLYCAVFIVSIFILNCLSIFIYRKIAINRKIVSYPNFRTLHNFGVPRGGGIVFSSFFVIGVFILWYYNLLSEKQLFLFGFGGGAATLFGLIDDIYDLRASKKLLIQICFSVWVLSCLDVNGLLNYDSFLGFIYIPLSMLFIVWTINAYNFIDGIDGIAASGALYILGTFILIMLIVDMSSELLFLCILLMASLGAFTIFNWPSASIFMGDSGSIFLGYIFSSIILITVFSNQLSIWTWLVIFGYFFADTSVTQIARIILVKKFYRPHRSHAYQNLARITGSHLKVSCGINLYNILWLLPLALWTVLVPEMEIVAALLALTPALVLAYKYGPVLSSS
ncbi:hypothetical protein OAS37_02355 [Alphaproteobacteria bacterium]|nr:hypothetical protein [Alphaproteobacteria bacterium]